MAYIVTERCVDCRYTESCEDIFPSQEPAGSDSEHQRMKSGGG